jgi:uncharacterized protein YeaO (DUF488 family)
MILTKRVYDPRSRSDGKRILVDRFLPRGIKKEESAIDDWLKEIAPSDMLRQWFGHDPAKWPEFKQKYKKELRDKTEILGRLRNEAKRRRT